MKSAYGVAVNAQGEIFVADADARAIYKFESDGTASKFKTEYATGMACDANGNLFATAGGQGGEIYKITPAGSISTFAGNLFPSPHSLCFDSSGNLFATAFNHIFEVTPAGVESILFTNVQMTANGAATDATGNVYIANATTGKEAIWKITPSGEQSIVIRHIQPNADGIAIDSNGAFYVACQNNIYKYLPDGTESIFATGSGHYGQIMFVAPEPSSIILVGLGGLALIAAARSRGFTCSTHLRRSQHRS